MNQRKTTRAYLGQTVDEKRGSLTEAKQFLIANLYSGVTCPCCERVYSAKAVSAPDLQRLQLNKFGVLNLRMGFMVPGVSFDSCSHEQIDSRKVIAILASQQVPIHTLVERARMIVLHNYGGQARVLKADDWHHQWRRCNSDHSDFSSCRWTERGWRYCEVCHASNLAEHAQSWGRPMTRHCPGYPLPTDPARDKRIEDGEIDFVNGRWVRLVEE